ncbi:MAG: SDR family oxidoreductase [Gallionella sp.]|nr:SDR family oxidoreductase [Gallionella sp.]
MSRVLVLGASGMLGHAVLQVMAASGEHEIFGSVRSEAAKCLLPRDLAGCLIVAGDVENQDVLVRLFRDVRPQVVVNCIGLVKQLAQADDPLVALQVNAMLPHRIFRLCELAGARLVHVSTDCVFSGGRGRYTEDDVPDARDLYGRSKLLGEVSSDGAITLRTSIIGHELGDSHGLVDWFLHQQGQCSGYTRAVFSGLPTIELAHVIRDVVIPRPDLSGIYHVASEPISKYDLLRLIAEVYGKMIEIVADDRLVVDRSLRADRFKTATGYVPVAWRELVKIMYSNGLSDHVQ